MVWGGWKTYCGDHFMGYEMSKHYAVHLKLTWYWMSAVTEKI